MSELMMITSKQNRIVPQFLIGHQLAAMAGSRQLKLLIVASFILMPSFALTSQRGPTILPSETDNNINLNNNNNNHNNHHHHHQHHRTHHHRHHQHHLYDLHDLHQLHEGRLYENLHHHKHYRHANQRLHRNYNADHEREPLASRNRLQRRHSRRHQQGRECCPSRQGQLAQQATENDVANVGYTTGTMPPAPALAPSETFKRRANSVNRFKLTKRETLDMVVNRLHILESLDEQLRQFTEAASLAQQSGHRQLYRAGQQHHDNKSLNRDGQPASYGREQIYCQLKLVPSFRSPEPQSGADLDVVSALTSQEVNYHERRKSALKQNEQIRPMGSCLRNKNLLSQVPPYMLNLYRQLLYELHELEQQQQQKQRQASNSLATNSNLNSSLSLPTNVSEAAAVQVISTMMPYKAQIMRSFRQPKIHLAGSLPMDSSGHSVAGQSQQQDTAVQDSTPTANYDQGKCLYVRVRFRNLLFFRCTIVERSCVNKVLNEASGQGQTILSCDLLWAVGL